MASLDSYNSKVEARTQAARQILNTPDLLKLFISHGGLKRDLEKIVESGELAEAHNQAQTGAQAAGGAATVTVQRGFVAVQAEYSAIMGVTQAVTHDLEEAGADGTLIATLKKILVNEAEVRIRQIVQEEGAKPEGDKDKAKAKKAAIKSRSQEALRAEIQKDAQALIDLKAAHKPLAERGVPLPRLKSLHDDSQNLKGHLADRVVKKADSKALTGDERAAVTAQKAKWGAIYRILAATGRDDARVAALLAAGSNKKKR